MYATARNRIAQAANHERISPARCGRYHAPGPKQELLMKPLLVVAAVLVLAGCGADKSGPATNAPTASAHTIAVINSGFEQTADDGTTPGWTAMMHADPGSFRMGVDAE